MKQSVFLSASFAGVFLLSACSASTLTGDLMQNDSSSSAMMKNTSAAMTDSSVSAMTDSSASVAASEDGDAMSEPSAETRVIEVGVTNWEFNPKSITLKKGEKVTLRLKGVDGIHSFLSADLGLNVRLNPGETKDIEIPTDEAGTFSFRCGVPCGEGHKEMTGTIVVE